MAPGRIFPTSSGYFAAATNTRENLTAMSQIDEDYALTQEQIDFYRKNGFIQLNNVVTGETLQRLRDNLADCIGCGCLSLRACALFNPDDVLSAQGPGPVRL